MHAILIDTFILVHAEFQTFLYTRTKISKLNRASSICPAMARRRRDDVEVYSVKPLEPNVTYVFSLMVKP